MNKGQEKLVVNNMDLVPFTINRMGLIPDDDLMSEGALGLVRAAINYDATKGHKFTTYAVSYIRGYLKTYLNTKAKIVKPRKVDGKYLESRTTSLDCSESLELEAADDNVESLLIVKDFLSKLDERERFIVKQLMVERTQAEIAKQLNTSQAQISRIVNIIRFKYRRYSYVRLI